jgi:hypothetical protein
MRYAAAVLVLALSATPAFADAVTYKGTLGKLSIIVELADPASSAELGFGRYAYMSKGIDIPLDPLDAEPGTLAFVEQLPCTEKTCTTKEDGSLILDGPIGAAWELKADGDGLTGTWVDGDKSLPVKLTRVGSRPIDPQAVHTAGDLADVNIGFLFGEGRMTEENDPYDYAKMQVDQMVSEETDWDGIRFQYLTDPRVGLAYPRIVKAGETPLFDANAYLESRQFAMNADALNCKAKLYAGMGYMGMDFGGTLGGWDEETVTVTYLSPTVLAWTEAGSLWCGGAYPENHLNYYALDLATGEPLELGQIFEGWASAPPANLVEFIKQNREHDSDADWEAECGIDDLVADYLAVEFKQDGTVTFALSGLPHAINACGVDLYTAPLTELVPYLASSAENYFPALAD